MANPVQPLPHGVLLSRNEAETLAAKAARGAGLPWGLAEEAGFAAGWLHAAGIEPMTPLLGYLAQVSAGDWERMKPRKPKGSLGFSAQDGALCPIALGAALLDFSSAAKDVQPDSQIGPIACPILLLPFLAALAGETNRKQQITLGFEDVTVTPDGQVFSASAEGLERLALAKEGWLDLVSTGTTTVSVPARPVQPTPLTALQGLDRLALQTTVPATSASRADAGAGGSDND